MPKVKTQLSPKPSREKNQRSLDLPEPYLIRYLPPWSNPSQPLPAEVWRQVVRQQPIAVACREAIISNIINLDWKIEPRDSSRRDELKSEIDYYTKFFQYTGDYDYIEIIEWVLGDMLDIPFGGAAEVGRQGDDPKGRVLWLELLDGGTLYPTPNKDWPVAQTLRELPSKVVYFPEHAINRIYVSPRSEIRRKGWGMPPPEKIYLAIELLNRGDIYYANLLLDTPEAGILDLGDMSKVSAEEWVKAFRELLFGIDPLKIPVLYEHQNEVRYIPFGRPPTDLMFDKVVVKYASIITAGYGISLSDIGFQAVANGGETLAGSIRQERQSRKSGYGRSKKKMKAFWDRLLPESLEYTYIDLDDELSVAKGRTLLSEATAWAQYISSGIFTPEEARQQTIADGLISISIDEHIPEDISPPSTNGKVPERPSMLGRPIAPSAGGQGEIRSDAFTKELDRIVNIQPIRLKRLIRACLRPILLETQSALEELSDTEIDLWNEWHDMVLWGEITEGVSELTASALQNANTSLDNVMKGDEWWKPEDNAVSIVDDLLDLFCSVYQSKLRAKAELDYEIGKSDILVIQFENNEKLEKIYRSKVTDLITETFVSLPSKIKKSVIAGVRNSLSNNEIYSKMSMNIDETLNIHDNMVSYVRNELYKLHNQVINEFAGNVSKTILELMEKI